MRKDLSERHGTKRILRIGLLPGFLVLLCFNMLLAQEVRVPKLSLVEDRFDFKEVIEGEIVSHSFIIRNQGNDTLKILQVKPG